MRRRIRSTKLFVATTMARVHEAPILVLGNQKSGTTAIAALLAEYAGLSATLDLSTTLDMKGLYGDMLVRVHAGQQPLEAFIRKHKLAFSRELIKEPHLTFLYPKLAQRFPKAQFVMIIRDPRDNIRSILNRLQLPGHLEQVDLAQIDLAQDEHYRQVYRLWELVMDGTWLGLRGNTYIEMLAARWTYAAELYAAYDDVMHLVRYEDFVQDKEGVIAALACQLGLSRVNDIAGIVDVQYQPRGHQEVDWRDFFGVDNLSRIERMCGNQMRSLGYVVDPEPVKHEQTA